MIKLSKPARDSIQICTTIPTLTIDGLEAPLAVTALVGGERLPIWYFDQETIGL